MNFLDLLKELSLIGSCRCVVSSTLIRIDLRSWFIFSCNKMFIFGWLLSPINSRYGSRYECLLVFDIARPLLVCWLFPQPIRFDADREYSRVVVLVTLDIVVVWLVIVLPVVTCTVIFFTIVCFVIPFACVVVFLFLLGGCFYFVFY